MQTAPDLVAVRPRGTRSPTDAVVEPKKLPFRVLAHFGIPAADIRVYKGK